MAGRGAFGTNLRHSRRIESIVALQPVLLQQHRRETDGGTARAAHDAVEGGAVKHIVLDASMLGPWLATD